MVCHIKTYCVYTLNRSFTHAWFFLTACIGQTKNYSLSYTDLLGVGTFHHEVFKKVTLVNITTDFTRQEESEYWEASRVMVVGLIFAWKLKCYHWQQTLCAVVFEMTCLLHASSGKSLPNTAVWEASVAAVFGYKNGVPWKMQLVQLATQTRAFLPEVTAPQSFLHRTSCFT